MHTSGAFDWKGCGRELFEQAVEALLVRKHASGPGVAQAIDGRGGDEGIDVDVTLPDGTIDVIYQLKFFPEGISGGFVKRRDQVKSSFQAAMKNNPRRWVLVVPGNLTTKERSWLRKLGGKHSVIISAMARAELDGEMAKSPDIYRYFSRDTFESALRVAGLENASLSTPESLENALSSVHERAQARSIFWGESFRVAPDGSLHSEVYPKRPDAGEKEPLAVRFDFREGPAATNARAALRRHYDFGGPPVDLSPDAVSSVDFDGPKWFSRKLIDVSVRIGADLPMDERPAEFRVIDASGASAATLRGRAQLFHPGVRGVLLRLTLAGGVELDLPISREAGVRSSTTLRQSVRGESVTDVASAFRFMRRLHEKAEGDALEVWIAGERLATFGIEVQVPDSQPDAYLEQVVDDAAVVSRHFDIALEVPDVLTLAQRIELRKLRLLVEGNVIEEPGFGVLQLTLNGSSSPEFEVHIAEGAFIAGVDATVHYLVLGHKIGLPNVRIFHPRAEVDDTSGVLDYLRSGPLQERVVKVRGVDGTPFRVFVPALVKNPDEPLVPTPLGLVWK